jgi:hypothetical protein
MRTADSRTNEIYPAKLNVSPLRSDTITDSPRSRTPRRRATCYSHDLRVTTHSKMPAPRIAE